MNKKKGRLLVCALAVTMTNFVYAELPAAHAQSTDAAYNTVSDPSTSDTGTIGGAQQQTVVTDNSMADGVNGSPNIDTAAPINGNNEQNGQNNPPPNQPPKDNNGSNITPIDAWKQQRPQETELLKSEAQYNGMTVVSVDTAGMDTLPASAVLDAVKVKSGDTFKNDNIEADRQAIYETGLFYDNYPSYEVVPEGVKITYHVMENPILKKVNISGNRMISSDTIKNMLTVKEGEVLNSKNLSDSIANIEAEYKKEGYILAKVSDMSINEQGILNLKFSEGILEGYTVKGNDKTRTKVITREMRMKPGDAFNAKLAKRSMQRIYNLGFFEDVNMKLLPGKDPNGVIIETTVVEKRTGSFGIGAGYSSSDGVIGTVSLSDINFRGTGDSASLAYEFGGNDNDDRGLTFTYRHPWLDSKETSMTVSLYDRTYEYYDYNNKGNEIEGYDKNYKGGEITLGRPQNEYATNYITIRDRRDEYKKHEEGTDRSGETAWLDSNFGTTRSITLTHTRDTRDNVYNPTQGSCSSTSVEVAGFGGDFSYDKHMFNTQRYYDLGHAHVLALRLNTGYSNKDLPEAGQFQVGGQGSLRGYRDDQFKGNNMVTGTVEYRFPVAKKVQGALFFDAGDAWKGPNWSWQSIESSFTLHHAYGVGVQIQTPVGPLRLDYGIGEDGGRVDFSVGGMF